MIPSRINSTKDARAYLMQHARDSEHAQLQAIAKAWPHEMPEDARAILKAWADDCKDSIRN
jgi:hypothetical protein